MGRNLAPEAQKSFERRRREGFLGKYLSGDKILDIGYRGGDPHSESITDKAIGVDLDYPGYDGKVLPFPDESQDAVFASHVLEHVEDWAAVIYDWYRVVRTSGYLIIAVPHQDLYERKSAPPSLFNLGHRRFYTPASLLSEVEEALPVGSYRIRSLKDVDEGFDYTIPPDRHAAGSYEIELVLQRIRAPEYAGVLRPSPVAGDLLTFYAKLLLKAVRAERRRRVWEVGHIQQALSGLPLPAYPSLRAAFEKMLVPLDDKSELEAELSRILKPLIAAAPFDAEWYVTQYVDIAAAISRDPKISPHLHFTQSGYFEGRLPGPQDRKPAGQ